MHRLNENDGVQFGNALCGDAFHCLPPPCKTTTATVPKVKSITASLLGCFLIGTTNVSISSALNGLLGPKQLPAPQHSKQSCKLSCEQVLSAASLLKYDTANIIRLFHTWMCVKLSVTGEKTCRVSCFNWQEYLSNYHVCACFPCWDYIIIF